MSKRNQTFMIMFLIYLVAFAIGIVSFLFLNQMTLIIRLLLADVVMTLFTWIMSLIMKNASVYDPYWSVIPPVLIFLVILFLGKPFTLSIALLFIGFLVWGIRLTYNWATRWQDFSHVDWRYENMRQKAPKIYALTNLFGIQLFPTLIVFVQLIGAVYFIELAPALNLVIWIGFVLMIFAAIIQFVSDTEMKKFKERTKGEKLCIEEGLWKYSRHPNYFGEITLWWGVYLMYLGALGRVDILIFAPVAMTALFVFVSIPWMEKKILSTRPEYAEYQKRVSRLIPFFRKEANDAEAVNES